MLRTIKEKKKDLLLLQDEEGNTPLHFAALKGYKKGVRYLLEIKSNWAFERNTNGFYPLHLACENGHIKVMKELFRKWADPAALLCNKGQSILHVAAKSGKDNVVKCILSKKGTDKLVNKIDKNEDQTAKDNSSNSNISKGYINTQLRRKLAKLYVVVDYGSP